MPRVIRGHIFSGCGHVQVFLTLFLRYLHAHLEEIFTNLNAVAVYAPSGNTGGVEVEHAHYFATNFPFNVMMQSCASSQRNRRALACLEI